MSKEMWSENVVVTPEIARQLLATVREDQRKLDLKRVNRYAALMADGQWPVTGASLQIDTDGYMIDGQHRLHAVVRSGVSIKFMITHDVPPESFDYIDRNGVRTAAQFYQGKNVNLSMSGARYVWQVEHHLTYNNTVSPFAWSRLAPHEQVEYAYSWPELEEWSTLVKAVSFKRSIISVPGRLLMPVIMQAARTPWHTQIEDFILGLREGINLGETDPRLLLRSQLVNDPAKFAHTSLSDIGYSLIVKTWNAYVQREVVARPLKVLKVGPTERRYTVLGSQADAERHLEPLLFSGS